MEYYSAIKSNDIIKSECKMIKVEKNFVNEVTQTQKDKHGLFLLISGYWL